MKLEVGMYVRTKSFKGFPSKIGKITKIEYNAGINNEIYIALDNDEESCRRWTKDYLIGEPSNNIIDLIEVGDYVNGYKVSFKGDDYQPFVQCDYPVEEGSTNHYRFYEKAIYSIVTKEQFESMSYKVVEE